MSRVPFRWKRRSGGNSLYHRPKMGALRSQNNSVQNGRKGKSPKNPQQDRAQNADQHGRGKGKGQPKGKNRDWTPKDYSQQGRDPSGLKLVENLVENLVKRMQKAKVSPGIKMIPK